MGGVISWVKGVKEWLLPSISNEQKLQMEHDFKVSVLQNRISKFNDNIKKLNHIINNEERDIQIKRNRLEGLRLKLNHSPIVSKADRTIAIGILKSIEKNEQTIIQTLNRIKTIEGLKATEQRKLSILDDHELFKETELYINVDEMRETMEDAIDKARDFNEEHTDYAEEQFTIEDDDDERNWEVQLDRFLNKTKNDPVEIPQPFKTSNILQLETDDG